MKVALSQVDGKWPNLALAKIAAAHRATGDEVGWFNPVLHDADVVYASKVFNFTPDNPYLPAGAMRGGTGYPEASGELFPYIEATRPDFSLWPHWDKSMGFTTRGCPRRCPFCVVPKKEGSIRVVADFYDVWDGKSREVVFLDNNITAAPLEHFRAVCEAAARERVRVDFNQGLDARLLTAEHAAIMRRSPLVKTIHFAFDHVRDEAAVRRAVSRMVAAGYPPNRLLFYVLIGYDSTPEEDMYRVELLRSLGADPFVMKYKPDDPYQRRFARWVNNFVAFNSMTWAEWLGTFKTPLERAG